MRLAVLVIPALAIAAVSANAQTVSWQGIGPVKLGMTAAEAEQALNTKLGPAGGPFSKDCYVTWRADGEDEVLILRDRGWQSRGDRALSP